MTDILKDIDEQNNKWTTYFIIILGLGSLFLGIRSRDFLETILGLFLLGGAVFYDKTSLWKGYPLGMKLITFFMLVAVGFGLESIDFQKERFFFGLSLTKPYAIIPSLFGFVIPLATIGLIYKRAGWKVLVGLRAFVCIDFLITYTRMLAFPLTPLLKLENNSRLQGLAPEALSQIEGTTKLILAIPMVIIFAVSLGTLVYIYKRRTFFSKH
ncbi:MAG: hypothetical protein HGA85_06265 [Nanoarchaeota archaeon]|nr:hypothetical protein [Nanoarchaeota archaeon]